MRRNLPRAFTLIEWLVVVVVIVIAVAMFIPATRSAREAARRMACSNNIREVGLACLNYESSNKRLPAGWGGPAQLVGGTTQGVYIADYDPTNKLAAIGRWSAFIALTRYIEASTVTNEIEFRYTNPATKKTYPSPMAPWNMDDGGFQPWRTELSNSRCPSDPGEMDRNAKQFPYGGGRVNYGFCYGDTGKGATSGRHSNANSGMFQGRYCRRLKDATDGLAHTLLLAEIASSNSNTLERGTGKIRIQGGVRTEMSGLSPSPIACQMTAIGDKYTESHASYVEHWRGMRWADGAIAYSGFNTILPPNTASCSETASESDWGYYTSTSYHGSGVNVLFADGAVRYIPNAIDCGNLKNPAPEGSAHDEENPSSPFGIWGAMGTRNSADSWSANALE
jgi:prepilin-type processing-associated H-X9-DG protein/prepilin-type N-terminal cleavage/methylation domain-containing protein